MGYNNVEWRYVYKWRGGETGADGVITMPYPNYPQEVDEFFRLTGQSPWCDYGYNPAQASRMVDDDAFIHAASLEEIKTMLTFCVRGERFCDGHWGYLLESGKLVKILERLKALKAEAAK